MTDKQMAEKKKEFFKGFVEPEYYNIDDELVPNGEYGEWLRDPDDVWQWISKLVEEVERECNKGKLRIERGGSSREYRLVCAMCNGDKSEFCRFCEGMGSHMITFN